MTGFNHYYKVTTNAPLPVDGEYITVNLSNKTKATRLDWYHYKGYLILKKSGFKGFIYYHYQKAVITIFVQLNKINRGNT